MRLQCLILSMLTLAACAAQDPIPTVTEANTAAAQARAVAALPLARVCRAGEVHWGSFYGLTVDVPIEVSNEGGRCSAVTHCKDQSWESARVITPPSHGIAGTYVSEERRATWLRYALAAGYVGHDEFAVRVEPPHQLLVVHVTVLPVPPKPQVESSEPSALATNQMTSVGFRFSSAER